jgi:hypothetical protein
MQRQLQPIGCGQTKPPAPLPSPFPPRRQQAWLSLIRYRTTLLGDSGTRARRHEPPPSAPTRSISAESVGEVNPCPATAWNASRKTTLFLTVLAAVAGETEPVAGTVEGGLERLGALAMDRIQQHLLEVGEHDMNLSVGSPREAVQAVVGGPGWRSLSWR